MICLLPPLLLFNLYRVFSPKFILRQKHPNPISTDYTKRGKFLSVEEALKKIIIMFKEADSNAKFATQGAGA